MMRFRILRTIFDTTPECIDTLRTQASAIGEQTASRVRVLLGTQFSIELRG